MCSVQVNYVEGTLLVEGLLDDNLYKVAQFHFHWGSTDDMGSEHTINGRAYPMEVRVLGQLKAAEQSNLG
jgi:carbonic anhydrase